MARPAGYSDDEYSDDEGLSIGGIDFTRKKYFFQEPTVNTNVPKEEQLFQAVIEGQLNEVQQLVNSGIDLNYKSSQYRQWTPLMHACNIGNVHIVKYLLQKGANPKDHHELLTPLLCLCDSKNKNEDELIECLDALIEFGVNINEQDWFKSNALVYAVKRDRRKLILRLLDLGCNKENTDSDGWTPIFYAVDAGFLEIVQILKDADANIKKTDCKGRDLYDLATAKHYKDIAEIVNTTERNTDIETILDNSRGYARMSNYEYVLTEMPNRDKGRFYGFHRDAIRWVNGIGLGSLVYQFLEKNVQLNELLTMEDDDLKKLGVILSYDRKKLKYCVQKFHEHIWGKNSLIFPQIEREISLTDIAKVLCDVIHQLHICNASTYYLKTHGGFQNSPSSIEYSKRAQIYLNYLKKEKDFILKLVNKIEEEDKIIPSDIILPKSAERYSKFKTTITIILGFCLLKSLKPALSWLSKIDLNLRKLNPFS